MRVAGFDFERICDLEPLRDANGFLRSFMPQDRYKNSRNLPLNKYGSGPFCKFQIPSSRRDSGVYLLTEGDEVRYVGECKNLGSRFNMGYGNISPKNCFRGGQETNCRLNSLIYEAARRADRVTLWFLRNNDHKSIEKALRRALNPPWNRV